MRELSRVWLAAAAALALCLSSPAAASDTGEATTLKGKPSGASNGLIAVGADPIPFALWDLEGNTVRLEDHLGEEAVMLAFWSFFCGPCREEIPLLDTFQKKYADQGFEVLSINLDGPKLEKAVEKYMDSNGFTFRVLWEEIEGVSYKTADAYGVAGTPSLVLIDQAGKVSWTHVGREKGPKLEAEIQKALKTGE